MQETTPQIIKTIGEEGEEIFMKLQEIVSFENRDYALLSIVKEDTLPTGDNGEEDEIVIMRMNKTDDECTFEVIEDDNEFNSVVEAINEEDELDSD